MARPPREEQGRAEGAGPSPLAALTGLPNLELYDNNVSDLTPLIGLTNLYQLNLRGNDISDLTPLVENSGLAEWGYVRVEENPIDCEDADTLSHIETLIDRGVELFHPCE